MSVKISGIEALRKRILNVSTKAEVSATKVLQIRTEKVLKELVLNTPQWSGSTAASWNVEIAAYPASKALYKVVSRELTSEKAITGAWREQSPVRFKGDADAYAVSAYWNASRIKSIRYNSKVSIVNVSPISDELATNPDFKLRPGNFIPGDYLAIQHTINKFKHLRTDIV
jgi:hypothetical protein